MVSRRRPQLAPWRNAGRIAEAQGTADEVVRSTGWVFNNETGEHITLAEFVATGTEEVGYYCHHLGLHWGEHAVGKTFVEIGSGIGRMTAALTQNYSTVIAATSTPRSSSSVATPSPSSVTSAGCRRSTSPTATP